MPTRCRAGRCTSTRPVVPGLRRAVRQPARPTCGPATGPAARSTPDKRFHADWALWKARAGRPRADLGDAVGHRVPRLAHRVLGDVAALPRRHHRRAHRRHRPALPAPRGRAGPVQRVAGHEVVRHWVHGEHLLFEGRKMAKSTGNVVLLARRHRARAGPAGAAARVPRAPLPAADEPRPGTRWPRRTPRCAAGGTGSPSGRTRRAGRCARSTPTQFTAAFDDDLDTPAALRALRALERDTAIPPGAKFETFVAAWTSCSAWIWRATSARHRPGRPLPDGAQDLLTAARRGPGGEGLGRLRPAARRTGRARRHGHRHPGGPGLDGRWLSR